MDNYSQTIEMTRNRVSSLYCRCCVLQELPGDLGNDLPKEGVQTGADRQQSA